MDGLSTTVCPLISIGRLQAKSVAFSISSCFLLSSFILEVQHLAEYSSLNLSQAVQILTYEIRLCLLEQQKNQDNWDVELANNEQTERLIAHMDELMQEVEFYDIDNPRKLLLRVRRFFKRSRIDVMEANIFRGLFSTIQKNLK